MNNLLTVVFNRFHCVTFSEDKVHALLQKHTQLFEGHRSPAMTENYDHSQLRKRERLAKKRKNPFVK